MKCEISIWPKSADLPLADMKEIELSIDEKLPTIILTANGKRFQYAKVIFDKKPLYVEIEN